MAKQAKKTRKPPPNWIDVLNAQGEWRSTADFVGWFSDLSGRRCQITDVAARDFFKTLRHIRMQLANLHFGSGVDLAWLNKQLKDARIELSPPSRDERLPVLHVVSSKNGDVAALESFQKTIVLQFALFVAESLERADGGATVLRCSGLYREETYELPTDAEYPSEIESRWRSEIEALKKQPSTDDILRCADFFPKSPKARFCSDACRFSTFQIMKQLEDPQYLAEKQKRYRDRQK